MLGWVAATGDFGIEAGTLFLIQFFGNSLIFCNGWFLYEDYEQVFL
jgi:protoheme IX farnesyltransferase